MRTRRNLGLAGVLVLAIALPLTLPGCGGGTPELGPDGGVKSAPGDVQLDKEFEPSAKKPK
ncbi:hypothetical protein V5E97_11100 [Singulisphaera sp. Ch08]|uniref:Uncharacterized protein n=1 Tax=Singulisphaera sp. Ch08 TaxID=3120278 RepID=A0AAU7CN74_9BACT